MPGSLKLSFVSSVSGTSPMLCQWLSLIRMHSPFNYMPGHFHHGDSSSCLFPHNRVSLAQVLCLWHTCVSSRWWPEPSPPAFFQDNSAILILYWPRPSVSMEKFTLSALQWWISIASPLMSSVSSFFPTLVRVHLIGWGMNWGKLWGDMVYIWDRLIWHF